ncbi:hypothetical protein [Paenibacillus oleatilyticus]|uniref:Uncharacterized protein n=1 Tax=Paenibacillus oleatilyticus TaxID=2594886 RepID=A0ABV4V2J9_9BACL
MSLIFCEYKTFNSSPFSRNILFMSFYTFFTIPFSFNIFLSLGFNNSIPLALLSTFITTILIFTLLYLYNKKNHRKEYLDHSKIAFDIIRFVFVVILALTAIYGKINDDFSIFTRIVPIFKNNTGIDELRNSYQLTFQILAIPFVFSATLLRILVDWLLLKK